MGIHADTLDFFWESVKTAGITRLLRKQLLELGNQEMRRSAKDKYKFESKNSKIYFLTHGSYHISIDWNCCGGAVPIDMCKPIPVERYRNNFDIVTDFGCMEHYCGIENLPKTWGGDKQMIYHWQSWKNIHDMGKVGCVYIHCVPLIGSSRMHGYFHYDLPFFVQVCKHNSYEILYLRQQKHDIRIDYVFCSYVKKEDKLFAPGWEIFKGWLHR